MRQIANVDAPPSGLPHLPRYGQHRVVADWRELSEGDSVVLLDLQKSGARISGTVDAVSADGALIWLVQNDSAGRRIFHQADGYKTLLHLPSSEP